MRILILSLLLCSCGPPPAPQGRYHGDLTDHEGRRHECRVEITPTSPDRVHIHLDYADQCDGDGALICFDVLLPDSGGEISFNEHTLDGNFFSAIGNEYRMELTIRQPAQDLGGL